MADYFQVKNQNIFNPPANTSLGNATNQFNDVYVQNDLVLGNVTVTGTTIIAPRITTITYPGDDTAADTAGGQTITLTGTGFVAGANLLINGSAVGVVSVVSSTTITFTSPANSTGSYVIYVINPDGSTAIAIPGIQYSGTPTWTTAAGTLGNVYETDSFTQTVTATGDAPITYSVVSGSIPPGSTFNANGTITGTSQLSASPTTYSFTVRATDAQLQDTNRAFSIAVIPDVVTWSSPTNNTTYSPAANIAIANITLSATSAVGSGITYSANTLPTGLSLTGANISGTPTVQANTSSLLTATANTTTESSSITINWSVSVSSDPYFIYNSLLLPGTGTNGAQNNTFLDSSTNNFNITRNGNPTQGTFSPYGPNWSNYFDGAEDTVSAASDTSLIFGTGDFTVECWFNSGSQPGPYNTIIGGDTAGSLLLSISGIGTSTGVYVNVYGSGSPVYNQSYTVTQGIWFHLAATRSGTSFRVFVNGTQLGATVTDSTNFSAATRFIGGAGNSNQNYSGYVSNARLVKGTAVYTSNFVPSTTPLTAIANTSLLTCQSNRFIDNSTNAFAITVSGNTNVQRFSPFSPTAAYSTSTIGGSGYFDGSGDFLTTPSNVAFNVGNTWTVECWYYPVSKLTTYPTIFGISDGSFGNSIVLNERHSGAPTKFSFSVGTYGLNPSTTDVIDGRWYHIALVSNNGVVTMYVNGTAEVTANLTAGSSNKIVYIGTNYDYATYPTSLNGYISNLRIVKSTAVYTANFTPPTSPVTAITNTSLLTNFTNAGLIDNTMLNNLETVGNAQISTAQSQFGGGSMSFDGTGDYLSTISTPNLSFGSGNFTIECWVYANSLGSYNALVAQWPDNGGTTNNSYVLEAVSPDMVFYWVSGSTLYGPATLGTITKGVWTHYAICRSGNTLYPFKNGVLGTTVSISQTLNSPTSAVTVGGQVAGGGGWNGYIDDLRITKGIARYTSNFTPPIAAFPTY